MIFRCSCNLKLLLFRFDNIKKNTYPNNCGDFYLISAIFGLLTKNGILECCVHLWFNAVLWIIL